jgi:hypothetical protein
VRGPLGVAINGVGEANGDFSGVGKMDMFGAPVGLVVGVVDTAHAAAMSDIALKKNKTFLITNSF